VHLELGVLDSVITRSAPSSSNRRPRCRDATTAVTTAPTDPASSTKK
jgi:hypothetical protein